MSENKNRILSLDVFRGITIIGMILVNNPGTWSSIYPPLKHAAWHGCTPTDWIFPFFLFIVGVSIDISLNKRKERGDDKTKLIIGIARRAAILILLGLLLTTIPKFDLSIIRIPGVLQRIGVVYLIAATLFLYTNLRQQIIIASVILIGYWLLMTLVPVPGVGYANLEPGTNLAAWVDSKLLAGHMWSVTKTWDPEGILSTFPAVVSTISGMMLGAWLRKEQEPYKRTVWIFVAGVLGLVAGEFWSIFFPLNKSLWTSSYVLYTSGIAAIFFAMCYWIVDVMNVKFWTYPFVVSGMNAILIFFGSGLMAKFSFLIKVTGTEGKEISLQGYLFTTFLKPYFTPENASLIYALLFTFVWFVIAAGFHKFKIFLKV